MRGSPNSETSWVIGISSPTGTRAARLAHREEGLGSVDRWERALAQAHDARAERVAHAQALIHDASYPSEALINKVAALLANHLGSSIGSP